MEGSGASGAQDGQVASPRRTPSQQRSRERVERMLAAASALALLRSRPSEPSITPGPAPALSALKAALSFFLDMLHSAEQSESAGPAARGLQRTASALQGALQLVDELPMHTKDARRIADFSAALVSRLEQLPAGGAVLVPCGWSGGPDASQHLLLLAVCHVGAASGGSQYEVCFSAAARSCCLCCAPPCRRIL